tara:strand:+ start:1107 stop:1487 length:381 start_codon:yes stop_codon:yes gene_type:complete
MDKPAEHASNPGYETTDAHVRPLAGIAIFLVIFIPSVFLGIVVLFKVIDYYQPLLYDDLSSESTHPLADTRLVSSEPVVQVDPPAQKAELEKIEQNVLTTYDWVDKEKGIARIPIKRAIEILSEGK